MHAEIRTESTQFLFGESINRIVFAVRWPTMVITTNQYLLNILRAIVFLYIFGGLECVVQSFAYAAHFVFLHFVIANRIGLQKKTRNQHDLYNLLSYVHDCTLPASML